MHIGTNETTMLTLIHSQILDKTPLQKWHLENVPRVLRTGRTKCCFTNHYQVNDGLAICTNSKCANYLAETHVMKRHRVKRLITGGWLFLFLAVFTFDDYSNPDASQFLFRRPMAPL